MPDTIEYARRAGGVKNPAQWVWEYWKVVILDLWIVQNLKLFQVIATMGVRGFHAT
jgi:hypothetical protein